MNKPWSCEEVEATVADYFAMLASELRGEPYTKAEHRRHLQSLLVGRNEQSIEFKHANISAVLIELGFPYIAGYKPRSNYQHLLRQVVEQQLATAPVLQALAAQDADLVPELPTFDDILHALTSPPERAAEPAVVCEPRLDPLAPKRMMAPINYLEREARNLGLGLAGEQFVLRFEQARLLAADREALAVRVEHVSRTQGNSVGFDVLSFDASGCERLIEVKTTKYGIHTPFYLSSNELHVSSEHADSYYLYRVFNFRTQAKLFALPGNVGTTCRLNPCTYIARVA